MGDLIKKDLKYIWHPYTQMKDCEGTPPILIKKAKGIRLYDNKGNFYYDTISSWWSNVHGHCHPHVRRAIARQVVRLEHVLFAGFTHENAILLAEKLIKITGHGLSKVFFSDDGSTAVETALKMSFQYWKNIGKAGKTKFASLDHGYHGDTIGAMAVGGISLFNELFKPLFFKSFKVPSPYCYRCPIGKTKEECGVECIKFLEELFKSRHNEIAAFIIEPLVMAAGGMIVYPKEYLGKAAALAKKYNIHLILDEVATGFGRTGKMFAFHHVDINPDFLCLSKGLTAGFLPLAAALTTERIYRAFYADYEKKKTFYHGHTYTANPISTGAALAGLDVFEKERTLERANRIAPYFHERVRGFERLKFAGDVRYIGMIGAIELVKDKKTKEPFSLKERVGLKVYKEGLKNHLILRPLGNVIYFFLPLCATRADLKRIMDNAYAALQKLA